MGNNLRAAFYMILRISEILYETLDKSYQMGVGVASGGLALSDIVNNVR